jgi:trans-2,3-dihydro-3-hydroxyanthranilate isomerase
MSELSASLELPYAVVDVFTEKPFAGNPLAVVFESDELTDAQMMAITREFGNSETTFVVSPRDSRATWRLRSFTTSMEVSARGTMHWGPGGRLQLAGR